MSVELEKGEAPMNASRASALVAVAVALALASAAEAKTVKYDLAPGAVTPFIALRPDVPITIVGVQTAAGNRGVASATLLYVTSSGFIEWVGLHSPVAAAVTSGFSSTAGTLILYLDFSHCVRLEVAGVSGSNGIAVRNSCGVQQTGRLKITS